MKPNDVQQIAINDDALMELILNYGTAKQMDVPVEDIVSAYFVMAYEVGYKAGLAADKRQVTFIVRDDDAAAAEDTP